MHENLGTVSPINEAMARQIDESGYPTPFRSPGIYPDLRLLRYEEDNEATTATESDASSIHDAVELTVAQRYELRDTELHERYLDIMRRRFSVEATREELDQMAADLLDPLDLSVEMRNDLDEHYGYMASQLIDEDEEDMYRGVAADKSDSPL